MPNAVFENVEELGEFAGQWLVREELPKSIGRGLDLELDFESAGKPTRIRSGCHKGVES